MAIHMDKQENEFNFKKIIDIILSPKGFRILFAIFIVGVLLVSVSHFVSSDTKQQTQAKTTSVQSVSDYTQGLQDKLVKIISQISGAGKVDVLITLESGVENVYEQDQKLSTDKTQDTQGDGGKQVKENTDNEQKPVVVEAQEGGQTPVLKTQLEPKVKGVVVVCDGANDPDVQAAVTETVVTALDISSNHVCVTKRSKS